MFDPATNRLVITGFMRFEENPFFVELTTDGVVVQAHRIVIGGNIGIISAVALADDGGLFIAGHERPKSGGADHAIFVARLAPSRDAVVWARRAQLGNNNAYVGLTRSRRGDLVVWAPGAGPTKQDAALFRVSVDGDGPQCWPLTSGTLELDPLADDSIVDSSIVTTSLVAAYEPLPGAARDLPVNPPVVMRCSP